MTRPTPIFVLGIQRSGTTLVANLLCSHPEGAGVQAEDHQGIHESIFFSHFARAYGDLADDEHFERFARDFAACDYFLLTGLEESWLREQRPRSYAEAFRCVMDEFARSRGASFWVEKSPHHTLMAADLARDFPDARFVCVVRDPVTLIRSRLWAFGRTPPPPGRRWRVLVRACLAVSLYQRTSIAFAGSCDRATLVAYEDLVRDRERAISRLTRELGLGDATPPLVDPYPANTSFPTAGAGRRALGRGDVFVIRSAIALLRAAPLAWLRAVHERRERGAGVEWPDWCWKRRPRPAAWHAPGLGSG